MRNHETFNLLCWVISPSIVSPKVLQFPENDWHLLLFRSSILHCVYRPHLSASTNVFLLRELSDSTASTYEVNTPSSAPQTNRNVLCLCIHMFESTTGDWITGYVASLWATSSALFFNVYIWRQCLTKSVVAWPRFKLMISLPWPPRKQRSQHTSP